MDAAALVYVIDCDHGTKIGITNYPTVERRKADLERGYGQEFRVIKTWPFKSRSSAYEVEQAAHRLLAGDRTIGEWFHTHPLEACALIDGLVAHGIPIAGRVGYEEAARIRAHRAAAA